MESTAAAARPDAPDDGPVTRPALGRQDRNLQVPDLLNGLVADGLVPADVAATLARDASLSTADRHPLVFIAERKLKSAVPPHATLDLEALCQWLAASLRMEYRHIDPLRVDFSRIGDVMSGTYASRFRILPLEVNPGEVVIATAQPFVTEWVAELTHTLRKEVRTVLANPLELQRYLGEFFNLARTIKSAQKNGTGTVQNNFEQLVELGRSGRSFDANDQHIVTIVDWLWQYAFEQRASDIHMEPRRELGVVRFRIDGVLHNVYQVPPGVLSAMTSRIKLLGRMDVVEKRRPQDGRIKTRTASGREIELRLSTLPTAFGEKLVMRIFDPDVLVRDFEELGFGRDDLARWNTMTRMPNGIVLVTGPTGSGKTTTLYTTLKELATEEVNVTTVEDPIEMVENSFNQMQVQNGIDLDFAEGIRALMRQDPDIIMVGEIRDLETAEMAVQAALTGHLVLSTLHTNDAPSAVTRLLDLGVPAYLLNSTLVGVMAQRLVRTLCRHCKTPDGQVSEEEWNALIRPFKAPKPAHVYRPVGCLECRMTGYRGRTGLYEILVTDERSRQIVTERPDLAALRRHAMKAGMRPLRLAGAMRVAAGATTVDEVVRNAPPIET
ncbi:MAG: type II/IV secretion system protein [Burkholderiaceae bacterium]|nr:type II/IV secretion system protein [Burkholderiaceae bacterium]